jgi:23S rRNA (guanine745-N1)-methyltransferase
MRIRLGAILPRIGYGKTSRFSSRDPGQSGRMPSRRTPSSRPPGVVLIPLLCTVRGCALPLTREEQALRCARNHSFDLAASGYANLLGPQDRRSGSPGDRKEAVLARRSLAERGYADSIFDRLLILATPLSAGSSVLDVGCGEGTHLGRLFSRLAIDGSGIDISSIAIDLAARRYPGPTWVVANADRSLPYPDASFDLITSITGRRNPSEFARVLRTGGKVFIAVPAADDLAELREAVQGMSTARSRVETITDELREHFELESSEVIRNRQELDREGLLALLHATYRGLRHSERQRVERLEKMTVTFAWETMVYAAR